MGRIALFVCLFAIFGAFSVQCNSECLLDVVFVIDSSGSINFQAQGETDNWKTILEFVTALVDRFDVKTNGTRVGVVLFGNRGESKFYLNSYSNQGELESAILNLPYLDQNTNTAGGLRVMHYEQFTQGNGDRINVPNVAILITDGASTYDSDRTIPEAEAARAEGIKIFSVGVTDNVNVDEVRQISSSPHVENENYFLVEDFNYMLSVVETLSEEVC